MNEQPISKVDYASPHLQVVSVFHTIQGEGPFAGCPAIFVRFGGCNIRCPQCDTNYTKFGHFSVDQLLEAIASFPNKPRLVVLTGGEPLRQNLGQLVDRLYATGFIIQIETNGTLCPATLDYSKVHIVVSPKGRLNSEIAKLAKAFKYVVTYGHTSEEDGLPTSVLGQVVPPGRPPYFYKGPVYVQPADNGEDGQNALNTQEAINSCMKYGYTLCLQIHKIIGME